VARKPCCIVILRPSCAMNLAERMQYPGGEVSRHRPAAGGLLALISAYALVVGGLVPEVGKGSPFFVTLNLSCKH
jgi:hypothetical protein